MWGEDGNRIFLPGIQAPMDENCPNPESQPHFPEEGVTGDGLGQFTGAIRARSGSLKLRRLFLVCLSPLPVGRFITSVFEFRFGHLMRSPHHNAVVLPQPGVPHDPRI